MMKKIFLFLIVSVFILTSFTSVYAAEITLAWDLSPDASVVGYRIYVGHASNNYIDSITVGNVNSMVFPGLTPGATYFFAATAFDAIGLESQFSNEISVLIPLVSSDIGPVRSGGFPLSGILPATMTSTPVRVTTSVPSICRYSLTQGSDYASMTQFTITGGTTHSFTISLAPATAYMFFVKCSDKSTPPIMNLKDYPISFTTDEPVVSSYDLESGILLGLEGTTDFAKLTIYNLPSSIFNDMCIAKNDKYKFEIESADNPNGPWAKSTIFNLGQTNMYCANPDSNGRFMLFSDMVATGSASQKFWRLRNINIPKAPRAG